MYSLIRVVLKSLGLFLDAGRCLQHLYEQNFTQHNFLLLVLSGYLAATEHSSTATQQCAGACTIEE